MGSNQTSEEVRQEYAATMGRELGALFYLFWNECVWLHWKWNEYVALFGTKPERIDLLNRAAGAFFKVVQDTLWEDILLHISRLTDSPRSAGKNNLTLRRLPELLTPELRPSVERLLRECLTKCEFARDWRMRRIAHRDLGLALEDKSAAPLASASRKAVKEAVASISALLNVIDAHYRNTEVAFGMLDPLGGAESLLYVIRDGIEAEDAKRERLRSGTYTQTDIRRPPI